jgi:uncharacterized membrane protein (UPF0127 family)
MEKDRFKRLVGVAVALSISAMVIFAGFYLYSVQISHVVRPDNVPANPIERENISSVSFGDKTVSVELARTESEMARGLSGRDFLPRDKGMLFLLPTPAKPVFWMKDMFFPLDMVWIRDGHVVGVDENLSVENVPDDKLTEYSPPSDVDSVLEVNAGVAKDLGITVGSSVVYN